MKRVIIIQARMTSTRLPGKVLIDLAGKPMLAQQLRRLQPCTAVDQIVIATTVNDTDDPVVVLAEHEGLDVFRGSENDVLSRFVGAAAQSQAEVIIRVTADCPLIDAQVVDRVVRELTDNAGSCDYAGNVIQRSFPRGLDVEAFTHEALTRCDDLADTDEAREHVTLIIRQAEPGMFTCRSVLDDKDNSNLRWTVDTPADLELVRKIYTDLRLGETCLDYREILSYVRSHPELMKINADSKTWDPVENSSDSESQS